MHLIDIVLHLDKHLAEWSAFMGPWLYVLLFVIVFCETGLVVAPFLPGDSLLFAVGALSALPGSTLSVAPVIVLLIAAAVIGDAVNYAVGSRVGPRVFKSEKSWRLNKKHLLRAQNFYDRHGGKTIFLARFMPFIRTFAPFVAGIGKMGYRRFAMFNVTGAITWVTGFVVAGFLFGNLPTVKKHFQLVILAIIFLSILPGIIEYIRHRKDPSAPAEESENEPA